MKGKLLALSVSLLLLVQPVFANLTTLTNKTTFSKIVFFGDSLSDNGNLYRDVLGFLPKDPPYFKGRFSNGPVWSEHVEKYYFDKAAIETSNYAIGGQTAFLHNPLDGYLPYTLAMSRENYILHSVFTDRSSTLFVIWIGANDYLPGIKNIDQLTDSVTSSIKATIEDLIYHGATHFLIINLPDLSLLPSGKASGYGETLKAATIVHNLKLDGVVTSVQTEYKNINIHLYQVNQFFDKVLENPDVYNEKYHTHITNVSESCWSGGYTLAGKKVTESFIMEKINEHLRAQPALAMRDNTKSFNANATELAHYISSSPALLEAFTISNYKQTGVKPCSNPDEYIFWDKVHPGAIPHQIIAQELITFIDENYKTKESMH